MDKSLLTRLEEAKRLFDKAFAEAERAVKMAKEEMTRPLTQDEKAEKEAGL